MVVAVADSDSAWACDDVVVSDPSRRERRGRRPRTRRGLITSSESALDLRPQITGRRGSSVAELADDDDDDDVETGAKEENADSPAAADDEKDDVHEEDEDAVVVVAAAVAGRPYGPFVGD